MFREASEIEAGSTVRADVCIAGAGAAGVSLALALRGHGLEVALLESGGHQFEPDLERMNQGRMSGLKTWTLDMHRRRQLGGATNLWTGWCMPLQPHDLTARPYLSGSGWPIAYEDLLPYYRRARRWLELRHPVTDFAGLQGASPLPTLPSPGGRLATRVYQFSPPTRFGMGRPRRALRDAKDLKVYLHANLVQIDLGPDAARVKGFACATPEGRRFEVEARAYVLALGGIENARLLLASNGRLPAGVANSHDVVGRYFLEHPHYYHSSAWLMPGHVDLGFYERHPVPLPAAPGRRKLSVLGVLGLTPEVLEAEGLNDFTMQLIRTRLEPGRTGPLDADAIGSLLPPSGGRSAASFTIRAEQTPDPENRITLTDERDRLGVPRANLHWTVAPEDDRKLRRGLEIAGAELASAGLGRLWTPTDQGRFRGIAIPGGHHMGATRMSADPRFGVVDADCRCHDLEDLFIAGSSVFPTSGASNPTLTIVALAERLADHLLEVL